MLRVRVQNCQEIHVWLIWQNDETEVISEVISGTIPLFSQAITPHAIRKMIKGELKNWAKINCLIAEYFKNISKCFLW